MPYFPYSRQSKRKKYRGAIAARLVANLLCNEGMDHLITVDLHGFFKKPVDNLSAQHFLVEWIKHNVPQLEDAVVVSKNAGGSKRAEALACVLGLRLGLVTTAKRRWTYSNSSAGHSPTVDASEADESENRPSDLPAASLPMEGSLKSEERPTNAVPQLNESIYSSEEASFQSANSLPLRPRAGQMPTSVGHHLPGRVRRSLTTSGSFAGGLTSEPNEAVDEFTSGARQITTGRIVQGHIVDDDYPLPPSMTNSVSNLNELNRQLSSSFHSHHREPRVSSMMSSFTSIASSHGGFTGNRDSGPGPRPNIGFGNVSADGSMRAEDEKNNHNSNADQERDGDESDEDERLMDPNLEHEITLVGEVAGRTVLIIDDMMDKPSSWIAAAECCVKRGHGRGVYVFATHGLFGDGGDGLRSLEECDCIERVVVTNSFPISAEVQRSSTKLVVLDISSMLAEAIRRNHHGEHMRNMYLPWQ